MIRIFSDGPLRKSAATTTLLVEQLSGVRPLPPIPTADLVGCDGYWLEAFGDVVKAAALGAPKWELDREDGSILHIQFRSLKAFRPASPLVAWVQWAPGMPRPEYSVMDTGDEPGEWSGDDWSMAGNGLKFLLGIEDIKARRRPRLEEDLGWRAQMLEIDAYLKKPGTTYETAVRRFGLADLGEFNDDELDAEIEGEDIEGRRHKAAVERLKRHRRRWKKLPDSKKKT